MRISYNWLKDYISRLPTPGKLAEILTRHSFEVEKIKKTGKDWVLDIDILPNRAYDCLSHIGVARECSALLNSKLRIPNYKQITIRQLADKSQITNSVKVEVRDKNLCPRYCIRKMTDVKVGPAPKWLKERLEAIGQKSINNIVDATNYVMFEMGQPLHAFDFNKVESVQFPISNFQFPNKSKIQNSKLQTKKIIIRRAKEGERITTLEGEKYDLDENILVISDVKEPIALAGIKGGKKAEITSSTKNIILESANFFPINIRRTSKKLGLRTESSLRFEHGLCPNLAEEAINRTAVLIQEISGGRIVKGIIDIYPKKIKPKKIRLELDKVKRLLGIEIPIKEIKSILERFGFRGHPISLRGSAPEFTVPVWRLDISLPEDLIEEIGRIYGYEKIPSQLPTAVLIPSERNESLIYENKIRDILAGIGFAEVYNYSFVSEKDIQRTVLWQAREQFSGLIEVKNPISQEQKYLRPNLILNLLKNVKDNLRFFDEIRLFEIGKVFGQSKEEGKRLGAVIAFKKRIKDAQEFYRLKGIIDSFLNKFGLSDIWYGDLVDLREFAAKITNIFYSGRRAEIKIGEDAIGYLGEINPEILEKLNIKSRVAGFEIDFEKLVRLAVEERIYMPPSKYPAMTRDIAVLVKIGTKVAEVLNLINAAGGSLVRDVDLFDMYEGENIPEGKKNLAFHVVYQSDERTLTDKEVNEIHNKIIEVLEKEGGWEVRK